MNGPHLAVLAAALTVPFAAHATRGMEPVLDMRPACAPIAGEPGCLAQLRLRIPSAWPPDGRGAPVLIGCKPVGNGRPASDVQERRPVALPSPHGCGAAPAVAPGFVGGAGAALAPDTVAGSGDLIALCHPRAWAAEPCFCSVEGVETAITPRQFILHMRERRAAGATSAAELRAAMRHADEVCSQRPVAAPIESFGTPPVGTAPASAPHRSGPVSRPHEGRMP